MLTEIRLIGLVVLIAVLLSRSSPQSVAEAELQSELQQQWAELHEFVGAGR